MAGTPAALGPPPRRRAARGLTLVELVISIVIISIAVTGVLLAYTQMVARSADPMIDLQATAIAEAYLDEILAREVCGVPAAPAPPRDRFACVEDYYGLSQAPTNQFGEPIDGLEAYTVAVAAGPGGDLGLGAGNVAPVQVTVSHTSGRNLVLRGHRAKY